MKTVRRVGNRLIEAAHDHVANHMMRREMTIDECKDMVVKVKIDKHHYQDGAVILDVTKDDKGINQYLINMGGGKRIKVDRKRIYTEEDVR